jgi:hypothetical protein
MFVISANFISGQETKGNIVFTGIVMAISPSEPILSGDIPSYRLVKYKVEKVYSGRYEKREIVVDHLVLTGEELKNIKVGDKVKVVVCKSKSIDARLDVEGIRSKSEIIKFYYIAKSISEFS